MRKIWILLTIYFSDAVNRVYFYFDRYFRLGGAFHRFYCAIENSVNFASRFPPDLSGDHTQASVLPCSQ